METAETYEFVTEPDTPVLLEAAPLQQLIAQQNRVNQVVAQLLQAGTDYDQIPGTDKPTLLKPGAEKILWAFNCYPAYDIIEREIDHDREVVYHTRSGQSATSLGLYRFIVMAQIISRATGRCVGTGIGSASTLESKYISRPRDLENTVLKMAQKRALVTAVLNAFALSGRFTQDVEDLAGAPEPGPSAKNRFVAACKRLNQNWKQREQTAIAKALLRVLKSDAAVASFVEEARAPRDVVVKALEGLDQRWVAANAEQPPQLMDINQLTELIVKGVEAYDAVHRSAP